MTWRCPQGHESTESDYCSVCGLAIAPDPTAAPATAAPAASASAASAASAATGLVCPSCGEPRTDPSARYCEVCRYDFVNNAPGPAPLGTSAPPATAQPSLTPDPTPVSPPADPTASTPPAPTDPPAPPPIAAPLSPPAPMPVSPGPIWELRISVDPSLDTDPDPDFPVPQDEPEYLYPIDRTDTLIGRRDDRQDIHPELPVRDPGVSRRHAIIARTADGGLAVEDLNSTNGTNVNDKPLPPGLRRVLRDGDQITLGRWTRIAVRGGAV